MSKDVWLYTEEEKAEAERIKRRRQAYLNDLKTVVQSPEGYRIFRHLLFDMGVEQAVPHTDRGQALRERGDQILNDIQSVSVKIAMNIIEDIRTDHV